MISFDKLQSILNWTRKNNVKIRIFLKNYPYVLALDKVVHAEDLEGHNVSWIQAFGSKQPHQVLMSFPIRKIIVKIERETLELSDISSLFKIVH